MNTNAMSQIIDDVEFDLEDEDSNHLMLLKLLSNNRRKIIDPGLNLQGVGNMWFVEDAKRKRIGYFIKFVDKQYSRIGPVSTQIELWRKGLFPERGYPAKVTLGPLLDRHGKVMADLQQTKDGVRFWEGIIRDALNSGLHVYAIHLPPREVYRVKSMDDLLDSEMIKLIWNKSPKAQSWRMTISKEPIPNSMQMPEVR